MRCFNVVVVILSSWLACNADAAVAADGLGRLFFAPHQRAQLDVARTNRDRRAPIVEDTEQAAPPQGPDALTYNGMVRRSDGKSTVWINGKPITDRTRDNDVSVLVVRRDGAVSVAVPRADRSASLKVGQSMDVTSGTIEEPYARRKTLHQTPAKSAAAAAPSAAAARAGRRDANEPDPESGTTPPAEPSAKK